MGSDRGVTFVPDRLVNALDLDDVDGVVAPYAMEDFVAAAVLVQRLAVGGLRRGGGKLAILDPGGELGPAIATTWSSRSRTRCTSSTHYIVTTRLTRRRRLTDWSVNSGAKVSTAFMYFDDAPTMSGVVQAMVAQEFSPALGLVANARVELDHLDAELSRAAGLRGLDRGAIPHDQRHTHDAPRLRRDEGMPDREGRRRSASTGRASPLWCSRRATCWR